MGASGEERVSGTQSGLAGLLVCHAVPPCDLTRTKLTQEIRTKPSCQARRGAADMVHSRDRPDHHVRPEARHRQQHAQAWLAAGVPGVHAVHRSLVRDRCWQFVSRKPAGCVPEPGGDRTPVRAISGAGRYHPIYYAVVGLPLRLWPDWTGVLLARLISGALCAALFGTALMDALRWTRHRLMAVAVLVGVSPMATHMASAVNPSGVEIAAGVAFFAAAVPLLYAPGAERSRTLLWHVGVAALALAVLRAGGPLWVVGSVAALLLPLRWAKLRQRWAWRPVRWWMLVVGLAMVGSLIWTALFKTTNLGDFTHGQRLSLAQAIGTEVDIWREYADEMVGVMAWLDARMP